MRIPPKSENKLLKIGYFENKIFLAANGDYQTKIPNKIV